MAWFAAGSCKRALTSKFSDAAIQFCLMLKNLFGLALRQATGLMESVLQLCSLAWSAPDFSSLKETKMNRIKRLGERVMFRTFDRQHTSSHIESFY